MKILSMISMILVTQTSAFAGTVKQLLNEQNLAIIELKNDEKIEVGENFIVSEDKNQCLLEVISVTQKLATVTSKACSDKGILSLGKNVEKSLFDPKLLQTEEKTEPALAKDLAIKKEKTIAAPTEKREEPVAKEGYGSFYIGYIINPKILINVTAFDSTSSDTGTFEYTFSNAVTFGWEASQFRRHSWNNGIFVNYAALKFDKFSLTTTASGTGSGTLSGGMTLLTVAYAGKYRWDTNYFPFNVGFVSSTVDSTGTFTRTIAAKMLVSYGFGIALSEKFNLEFIAAANSLTSSTTTSSGTTIVPQPGFLTNFQINAKFLF